MGGPTTPAPAVAWSIGGDGIAQVVLNSPKANALGPPIIEGLAGALDAVEEAAARVVLISSALPGFFMAGADIRYMETMDAAGFSAYRQQLTALFARLATAERVSIAVVEGLALGGGLELAAACTLRVAGPMARFGVPEVKLGLIPGAGGTQRLPHLVGRGRALDLMLTGRQITAEEAYRIGLIDRLVDDGRAGEVARDLAAELRAASSPAQRAVLRSVDAAFDQPLADGLDFEGEQVQDLFERGDAVEGIAAFVAKRPPEFG